MSSPFLNPNTPLNDISLDDTPTMMTLLPQQHPSLQWWLRNSLFENAFCILQNDHSESNILLIEKVLQKGHSVRAFILFIPFQDACSVNRSRTQNRNACFGKKSWVGEKKKNGKREGLDLRWLREKEDEDGKQRTMIE